MRALVIQGPGDAVVVEVEDPVAGAGEVVVDVERAGVCGTDLEFLSGEMAYLRSGDAHYPMRIGHEWCGRVSAVGDGVDPGWIGRRVTGDTMLGCGHCPRCRRGRQHLCAERYEIGIRRGWPGALAERLRVPAKALLSLPEAVDPVAGAMVEPGGNALRAVRAAGLRQGDPVLIIGPGTIGLLAAMFAAADGADVHLLGVTPESLDFARTLGFANVWTAATLPDVPFQAAIDAATAPALPARAIELVEPGGTVVCIGIAADPATVDTRRLTLKDLTAVGILSASGGLEETIARYADRTVDPRPLVATTVALSEAPAVLAGDRCGPAPKVHIDPRR
ncbi:alcohol dehydrogenase catalytic domain-containing protein [Actinoplanes sp. NBRC 101535]|uniref:zinc-dependent alcohol dehydrogenase n=1 Tax=Actinoplanes sp. NBRC 101535 TaxID=3032196 RepID=UPI0024A43365|nr:alcohol dehydrogenase catalytic domain-containing protein [Actinoplanes sp. NBRC 101535]GLY08629.1 alcohol dehydrogenase [Actinoplanes sp. NBRC 101535]